MTTNHSFGGAWTEEKLERLKKYLSAYMSIFKNNEKAQSFNTIYVDAFAGTGHRASTDEDVDKDVKEFFKGSVSIALENKYSFDKYIFLEKKKEYADELQSLITTKYPHMLKSVDIHNEEANKFLQQWCQDNNWKKNRAVIFLDPYGMQVEWKTLEVIASTQGIDLWLLVPLGQGINRMLTRDKLPQDSWANKLTNFFGTEEWKIKFYQKETILDLFGEREETHKDADFQKISNYFVERLSTIFYEVAKPLELKNTKDIPLYMLCFAASNPKGAKTAVKIANHILKGKP